MRPITPKTVVIRSTGVHIQEPAEDVAFAVEMP